jgi:hypothetical protein
VGLFGASAGPDGVLGDFSDIRNEPGGFNYGIGFTDPTSMLPGDDDAGLYLFNRTSRCEVGSWMRKASNQRGSSPRELIWAIDDCRIDPIGFNREVANPFADEASSPFGGDVNPVLLAINRDPGFPTPNPGFGLPLDPNGNGIPNFSALPLRPGSEFPALPGNKLNRAAGQKIYHSQGLFLPDLPVRRHLRKGSFDTFDQNFSLNDLQWNRGASQEPWKELRELYVEFEAFESRLWVRSGKQTVVWGKTELFRNQDQWNPVDIAIGPLASLEESRIALWALRGIWSFYEVGPLEDVRLELVGLYDKFEPTDLGRCGEPFVPRLACDKTYGLWVHGQTGTGVAGEIRPDDPWNSAEGIEMGARVEFRWDRYSFAFTDYYGFADFPYQSLLFQYSRNVDPLTGRPRHTDTTGPCPTGTEVDCLFPGHAPLDPNPKHGETGAVVEIHSINQTLFAWICAGTVGVAPAVDAAACAFTLFNSQTPFPLGGTFGSAFSSILRGAALGQLRYHAIIGDFGNDAIANELIAAFGPGGTFPNGALFPPGNALLQATPLVPLVVDPTDLDEGTAVGGGLDAALSPAQEAMGGCGIYYFTDCDVQGIDIGNMEINAFTQSFPWFEGTLFNPFWDTADPNLPQPGTVDALFNDGFTDTNLDGIDDFKDAPFSKPGELETGPIGTRWENKTAFVLPGAHYDAAVVGPVIAAAQANGIVVDQWLLDNVAAYDQTVDGSTAGRVHPFTGQQWSNEMAILSWNFLMLVTGLGAVDGTTNRGTLDRLQPLALGRCSYRQPQYCAFVSGLAAQARNTRSSIRAGGNGRFGRRTLVWQAVGDLALRYEKRNIAGFSMDFAEDTTKSSWGVEFTWVNDTLTSDNDAMDGLSAIDEYNLTVSVDRPTFINFLNANRTFFINSQLFMSYLQGYNSAMVREGPWTALLLVNANTGYFQDRFLVGMAGVYEFGSQSMAFLPSVQYRFTENFSLTIGAAVLAGKWSRRNMGVNQFSTQSDTNLNDNIYVENGISPARDLDNAFVRLRYTY